MSSAGIILKLTSLADQMATLPPFWCMVSLHSELTVLCGLYFGYHIKMKRSKYLQQINIKNE